MSTRAQVDKGRKEFRDLCINFFFVSVFLFFINTFTFQFTYQPWFLYPSTAFTIILFFKYLDLRKMISGLERSERMGLPSGKNRRRLELLNEGEFNTLYNERDLV